MNKFLILIVLYECKVKDSLSYTSLLKSSEYLSNSKLILWDNSPLLQNVKNADCFKNVEYVHAAGNISLSKIYNSVITENEGYDYMIILDQDSSFSCHYFKKLNKAIIKHPSINLFLPIVKSDRTIVSPGNYKLFKGSYWNKEQYGVIYAKNIIAINSGMVINFNYLKNTYKGYDERLRFYGTDTFFMFEYSKDNNVLFVIDYVFKHASALLERSESIDKQIIRLNDLFFSWKITNEGKRFALMLINLYILIRIFKLVIKYKNLRYVRLLKIHSYD